MRLPLCGLVALLTACAPKETGPPIKSVATLGEVMHDIVIPSAEVVWDSVGTIYTAKGVEEIRPKDEGEWVRVEQSATALTEAANLLMMEGRAKDKDKWYQRSIALREAGAAVHKAAKARNAEAVFETGGYLFDACQGCHFEYRFKNDPSTIRSH